RPAAVEPEHPAAQDGARDHLRSDHAGNEERDIGPGRADRRDEATEHRPEDDDEERGLPEHHEQRDRVEVRLEIADDQANHRRKCHANSARGPVSGGASSETRFTNASSSVASRTEIRSTSRSRGDAQREISATKSSAFPAWKVRTPGSKVTTLNFSPARASTAKRSLRSAPVSARSNPASTVRGPRYRRLTSAGGPEARNRPACRTPIR